MKGSTDHIITVTPTHKKQTCLTVPMSSPSGLQEVVLTRGDWTTLTLPFLL